MSDIVKQVGVAQGTFYYYFKSKDEILNAVLDRYLERSVEVTKKIVYEEKIGAQEKLQKILSATLYLDNYKKGFFTYIHNEENFLLHQKMIRKALELSLPVLTDLLEQGIKEGVFKTPYPRETIELMYMMFGNLQECLVLPGNNDQYYRRIRAAENLVERVLGVESGSIHLMS